MRPIYFILLLLISSPAFSQQTVELSLMDIVALAKDEPSEELKSRILMSVQNPNAQIAKTRLNNNYWQYQSFLTGYKPQITLNATLPSFSRSIDGISQPDGTIDFVPFNYMQNNLNVSLSQVISKTGGSVSLSTGLRRVDVFQNTGNSISYLSTPINIGFNQPLFTFNSLEWDKIIEPMRFNEAKRLYNEDLEGIALNAANLFFDLFIAQLSLESAEKDRANADTLYVISTGRFNVGRIAETELLQMEIAKMNADAALAKSTLDLQTSTENLRNFLGIKEVVNFSLLPPTDIPVFTIDPQKALAQARASRSQIIAFDRQLKEAERDVEKAAKNNGFDIAVNGSFGLTQTDASLTGAYANLHDQEQLAIRLRVPIMDWGRAAAQQEIAVSSQELIKMTVEQDRINFDREILLKVQQFDLVRNQTKLALKNYEVSQKTYDLTRKRYLIGKIGVIDLNLALSAQERSRTAYMGALRNFWLAYFQIRRLTLYDFMTDKSLVGQ